MHALRRWFPRNNRVSASVRAYTEMRIQRCRIQVGERGVSAYFIEKPEIVQQTRADPNASSETWSRSLRIKFHILGNSNGSNRPFFDSVLRTTVHIDWMFSFRIVSAQLCATLSFFECSLVEYSECTFPNLRLPPPHVSKPYIERVRRRSNCFLVLEGHISRV